MRMYYLRRHDNRRVMDLNYNPSFTWQAFRSQAALRVQAGPHSRFIFRGEELNYAMMTEMRDVIAEVGPMDDPENPLVIVTIPEPDVWLQTLLLRRAALVAQILNIDDEIAAMNDARHPR